MAQLCQHCEPFIAQVRWKSVKTSQLSFDSRPWSQICKQAPVASAVLRTLFIKVKKPCENSWHIPRSPSRSAQRQSRVSIYQDGIDISRSRGAVVELFDIERIEVIKGPQATLFGSAASVGAISVITNKPTDEVEGKASVGAGNFAEQRFGGVVSVPLIGDLLRARLAVIDRQRDGYIENIDGSNRSVRPGGRDAEDLQGKDTFAARLIIDSRPIEDLLLEVIAQYQDDSPPGTAFKSAVLAPAAAIPRPMKRPSWGLWARVHRSSSAAASASTGRSRAIR